MAASLLRALVLTSCLTWTGEILAQEKPSTGQICANNHETAQVERLDGDLLQARKSLRQCASEECPSFIRNDCVRWLDEVEAELPTVVFEARGDSGLLTDVEVRVDGEAVATRIDGRAVALNPGAYQFEFLGPDGRSKVVSVLLRQGERNQTVLADFSTPADPESPTKEQASAASQPEQEVVRPVPPLVYAFGGVALVAAGTTIAFGVDAKSKESSALDECAPDCSDDRVDAIKTSALLSDVSLGISLAAAGTAAVLYLLRPSIERPQETAKARPIFGAGPHSAFVGLRGSF